MHVRHVPLLFPTIIELRRSLRRPGFDRRHDSRRGFAELGGLDGHVRLYIREFHDGLAVGPGHDRAERQLDSGDLAIIGIVNLNRHRADRRVAIAQLSDEKSAFIIEKQFDTGAACSNSLDDRDLFVFDRRYWKTHAPVRQRLLDSTGKPEIRIDSGSIQLRPRQQWQQPDGLVYRSNPTFSAVESQGAISILRMRDCRQLSRSLRVNFEWHLCMIGVVALISAFADEARQTSESLSTAGGLDVLV